MTTLITGGASQIGTALAKLLTASGHDVLFASRSGKIPEGYTESVKLDWYDPSTYSNPFAEGVPPIKYVYVLPPPANIHPEKVVNPFLEIAIAKGVKRFVVLSGSNIRKEDGGWSAIQDLLEERGVEYVFLKASWFMENFAVHHVYTIKAYGIFSTCIPTGKAPLVSVKDIAQAAYEAITSETNDVKEKIIIGPEELTYEEAANILAEELGRPVAHKPESGETMEARYISFGVPEDYAKLLIEFNHRVEAGSELGYIERLGKEKVHVGKVTLREWAKENKGGFD